MTNCKHCGGPACNTVEIINGELNLIYGLERNQYWAGYICQQDSNRLFTDERVADTYQPAIVMRDSPTWQEIWRGQ